MQNDLNIEELKRLEKTFTETGCLTGAEMLMLKDALPKLLEVVEENVWRPGEDAPKEGKFLTLDQNQGGIITTAWWMPCYGYYVAAGGRHLHRFTHWMPLPKLPVEGETL